MPPRVNKRRKIATQSSVTAEETESKQIDRQENDSFLIEKHRYTKGRLATNERVENAKKKSESPLCLRFGPHFIKTTFLMDRCNPRSYCGQEERALMQTYESLCTRYYRDVDWQVNQTALSACAMTREQKVEASRRRLHSDPSLPGATTTTAPPNDSTSMAAAIDGINIFKTAERGRKRVLISFSGGIGSMAALWWCLQQDYDVVLCYAFGALSRTPQVVENVHEIECLLRLLQYSRKKDGRLLFDCRDTPETGVHKLSRQEIMQQIRIIEIPQSAYYLSAEQEAHTTQPFAADENVLGVRLKAHPQAYLLMYRSLLNVAQSMQCHAVCLGVHGDARQLLQSAQPFFANKIFKHQLLVPFESRQETLLAFGEAATRSWQVWKSYFDQAAQGSTAGCGADLQRGIWRTAGPALMPNAAHYVSTCATRRYESIENILLQAQKSALEKVQCLLTENERKEQTKLDAATASGEKIRKKRAVDPFQHPLYMQLFLQEKARLVVCSNGGSNGSAKKDDDQRAFHFCNDCLDCLQWRHTLLTNKSNLIAAPQWQNLASEYLSQLQAAQNKTQNNCRTIVRHDDDTECDKTVAQKERDVEQQQQQQCEQHKKVRKRCRSPNFDARDRKRKHENVLSLAELQKTARHDGKEMPALLDVQEEPNNEAQQQENKDYDEDANFDDEEEQDDDDDDDEEDVEEDDDDDDDDVDVTNAENDEEEEEEDDEHREDLVDMEQDVDEEEENEAEDDDDDDELDEEDDDDDDDAEEDDENSDFYD